MEALLGSETEKHLENMPIYYYVSGEEHTECIMFLHAAFGDHTQYNAQVNDFAERYKVITLDLIGHGKSQNAPKGSGIENMAGWMEEILTAEGVETVHLVGVSLGAVVVQDFANKYPDRVASLSCFGGYDINHFDPTLQKDNSQGQMCMMLKAVFSIKWFAEANRKISAITPQAQQDFYEMNLRFPKKSFRYLAGLGSMVNRYRPETRPYRLLIGCGDSDIPMEHKACEQWKQSDECIVMRVIPQAGHLVNMDAPEAFNEILQRFLDT